MNKTTYTHPASKPIPEKSVDALKQLSEAFNSNRMVQIPVEEYNHLVRCAMQRDVLATCVNTYPDYMVGDLVRTVLGISKPDPAANTVTNEGNANA